MGVYTVLILLILLPNFYPTWPTCHFILLFSNVLFIFNKMYCKGMKNILKPLLPDIVMKPVLIPKLLKCPEYNIYVFYPILQKRCVYETQ